LQPPTIRLSRECSHFQKVKVTHPMTTNDDLRNRLVEAQYVGLTTGIRDGENRQAQIVLLTVIALGTAIGVTFQAKNPAISLAYPVFGLVLAVVWAAEVNGIRVAAAYIADYIELPFQDRIDNVQVRKRSKKQLPERPTVPAFGWEHYIHANRRVEGRLYSVAVSTMFIVSELAAIASGALLLFPSTSATPWDITHRFVTAMITSGDDVLYGALFIIDGISILLTIVIIVTASSVSHRHRWAVPASEQALNNEVPRSGDQ
jgi:hypothetical protein